MFLHLFEISNKEDQRTRAPTQESSREKRSGEKERCFFLACLPLVLVCVCLSSCLGLGSSGLCWSGVCPVRCLIFCCFRGVSFLLGRVPKTGNDLSGISAALPRNLSLLTSHSTCGSRREYDDSCPYCHLPEVFLTSPILPWHTPDVDLERRVRQNWLHRWPQRVL